MAARITINMPVRVNDLNSSYHGRKGLVLRRMGNVDPYDKNAECWEVSLDNGPSWIFRQNQLIEWSAASLARDAAYVDSLDA